MPNYEPLKKNGLSLLDDRPLDLHLKPLRIGEVNTPLELSLKEFSINSDYQLNGRLMNGALTSGKKYLEFRSGEYSELGTLSLGGKFLFTDIATEYWINEGYADAPLELYLYQANPYFRSGTNAMYFGASSIYFSDKNQGLTVNTHKFGANEYYQYESASDNTDYFKLATTTNGATTISTVDVAGANANLSIVSDGNFSRTATGNVTNVETGSYTHTTVGAVEWSVAGGTFTIADNTDTDPNLILKSFTTGGTEGGTLTFLTQREATAVDAVDGDVLGTIEFKGYDDGTPSEQVYASIVSTILDSESGGEQGQIDLKLAEYDGTLTSAYTAFGTATNSEFRHMWYGPEYRFYYTASNDSFCKLILTSNRGATTLGTSDGAGSTKGHLTFSPEGKIINDADIGGIYIKEIVSAGADTAGEGQLWIESTTPNRLRFRNDAGDDIKITEGTGLADRYWHTMIGGYATNKTSTTNYYTFFRFWYENWSNADSDPSSIVATDTYSSFFIAPRAGKITNIKIQGYASDTGATDPFKFYVYKGALSANATSLSLTALFQTSAITPPASGRTWKHTEDFTTDNTFSENDSLFIFWKKDSNTGSQDVYWNINVNGEYT